MHDWSGNPPPLVSQRPPPPFKSSGPPLPLLSILNRNREWDLGVNQRDNTVSDQRVEHSSRSPMGL